MNAFAIIIIMLLCITSAVALRLSFQLSDVAIEREREREQHEATVEEAERMAAEACGYATQLGVAPLISTEAWAARGRARQREQLRR